MGSYTVVAPCIVTVDGKSQHHTRTGRVVEVDDAEAAPLVDAGQLAPRERPAPPVDDPEPVDKPKQAAPKASWVQYAVHGAPEGERISEDEAEAMTKAELVERFN